MTGGKKTQLLCFRRTETQLTLQMLLAGSSYSITPRNSAWLLPLSLSCLSHRTTHHEHSYNNLLYINPCPRRTQAKTVNLRVVFPLSVWLQGCHQQGLLSSMDPAPVNWSPHYGCSALKSPVLRSEHCSKEQDCEIWDTWVSQIKLKIPEPL